MNEKDLLKKLEEFFIEIHNDFNFVKVTAKRFIEEYCKCPKKEIKLFCGNKTEELFISHFRSSTALLIKALQSIGFEEVSNVQLSDNHIAVNNFSLL